MYWNGDWNWGAGVVMAIMMVAFWGAIIWVALAVLRDPRPASPTAEAESVLAQRLARGEISPEEYETIRATIRGKQVPAG